MTEPRAIKVTKSRCSVRQHVSSHNISVQCAKEPAQVVTERTEFYGRKLCYKMWETSRVELGIWLNQAMLLRETKWTEAAFVVFS